MTLDVNTLYKDLLKSYSTSITRQQYEQDASKVAEVLHKNPSIVDSVYKSNDADAKGKGRYLPYPDYQNVNFNQKIYNKKEFNRAYEDVSDVSYKNADFEELSKAKCSQIEFKLTPNQKFVKNFLSPLTPYNGVLLYHSVGVGKTCTAISIAEQYHQLYQKPVLVILSSALIDNFKKQIFDITKYEVTTNQSNLCTGTAYPDLILDKHLMKIDVLEKHINKVINQRYKFMGYKKLVSIFNQTMEKVKRQEKDANKHDKLFYDKIKEYFSDRLIIIDEAHNLRNSSETGKKQISQTFWNLLKHTENVKMVLLTATPMYNSVSEIVWFLNLLLTNDKRPNMRMNDLFDKTGALTSQGKKKLIETARGYVSYMRGENPFSFPFRLYPSINKDKNIIKEYPPIDIHNRRIKDDEKIKFLEVIGSQMSDYQKRVYDVYKKRAISSNAVLALDDEEDLVDADYVEDDAVDDDAEDSMANDLQSVIQVSNIVYPVDDMKDPMALRKTFGKLGFENTFINTAKKGVRFRYSNQCIGTYGEILRYNNLATYAPKIKRIIDYVINSEGIVFIYSNYYPSGIKPLAIALEHIGFLKYNSSNLMVDDITIDNKFQGGNKRPSYVILSPKSELSPNNDKEIEMVKSKDNADGSIIKVVIASSIATEGIDFKRIREVHILQPWYNLNRSEQIIGRAVRTCSHIDLPKEKRNVTIYLHASSYDNKQESIDIRTYRLAEKKQKRITEVERIIKETSIDCNLNKELLTYDVKRLNMTIPLRTSQGTVIDKYAVGDRDYSYVCNYAKCELKCNPDIPSHTQGSVDDSTYDSRFIMDDVSLYKRYIGQLYNQDTRKAFTYDTILKKLNSIYKVIDDEVLQYALQELLDDKTQIYDNDNIRGYLIYRSNKYIFQSLVSFDKRMTIEQREAPAELKSRVKLDIAILKAKLDNGKKRKSGSSSSDKEKKETQHKTDIAHANVIQYITEQYNVIKNGFMEAGINLDSYDKYIVDSLIDRLSVKDYKKLIEELADSYNKRVKVNEPVKAGCLRSLLEAGVLIFDDENDTLKYFYNYFDGDMYCLRNDNEFKKCSPLDTNKISKKVAELMQKMSAPMEDGVKGHIETSAKSGMCDFKVRDNPKSSGYVCWKTSSLSLGDLKERIRTLDKKLDIDILVKKDLCYLYEIVLRSQGKKVFKRAISKNLK
jgi:superfamily II DNA or RNA helicase